MVFPTIWEGWKTVKSTIIWDFPQIRSPGGALQEFLGGDVPLGAWNP